MGKLLIVAAIAISVFSFTYGEKKETHLNTSDVYKASPSKNADSIQTNDLVPHSYRK
jgi:hypothetical protein